MSLLRFQADVVLHMHSLPPEDYVVNTWAFSGHNPARDSTLDIEAIRSRLTAFYQNIDDHLASEVDCGSSRIVIYDRDATPPRAPLSDALFDGTVTESSTAGGPHEVALCLSFREAIVSGRNRARGRGRVYLGPWKKSDLDMRPGTLCGVVTAAAAALLTATDSNLSWDVYSRADDESKAIVAGWCDNEWDTQRSRGLTADTRSLFP